MDYAARVKSFRCLRACVFWALIASGASASQAAPEISARKLGGVEVGFVEYNGVTASPDGRFLAIFSLPGEKGSDCFIFERRTHKTTLVPGSWRMEPLVFSHDAHALWVWGLHRDDAAPGLEKVPADAPFIALYDLDRKKFLRAFAAKGEEWDVPSNSALSRDGRTLIVAWRDGWTRGFGTRSGRQKWKRRLQDGSEGPTSTVLSSDGSLFLETTDSESGDAQNTRIVSTRSGRVRRTLKLSLASGMRSAFQGGRFAPRGDGVAVFQPDTQQWVFFDVRTGRALWKMGGPSRISEGDLEWKWSPDARWVAVSGPNGFELRDARDGHILHRVRNTAAAWGFAPGDLAFSPDGTKLYALTRNDTGFGAENVIWQLRLRGTAVQRRADAASVAKMREAERRFALSPRHINQSLIQAARGGDDKRVAFLLDNGANIEIRDGRQETPLSNAINANDVYPGPHRYPQTTMLLLSRGAAVKRDGGSLLAAAAAKGDDRLVRVLLKRGVRPDANAAGYGTSTALIAAVEFGHTSVVRTLLENGASPNARNVEEASPLLALAGSNFAGTQETAIARLLLDHGADINARPLDKVAMRNAETALSRAAWLSKADLVALLLERGADPNLQDSQGQTPLMQIARWDTTTNDMLDATRLKTQLKMVHSLLAHAARPELRDSDGKTAFDLATSSKLREALRIPR